jgi:hypothetical protein
MMMMMMMMMIMMMMMMMVMMMIMTISFSNDYGDEGGGGLQLHATKLVLFMVKYVITYMIYDMKRRCLFYTNSTYSCTYVTMYVLVANMHRSTSL